jgi:hypothetical protein
MSPLEKLMDALAEIARQLEERFRQARDAMQAYCDNPENRLSDPQFSKLVDEFFAAREALASTDRLGKC